MTTTTSSAQQRQQLLLDCAIAVVGQHGLRGLTHRAVDRAADVPEGTCSVYFRTRLALLTALTDHVAAVVTGDVQAVAESLAGKGEDTQAAIEATTELLVRWIRSPDLIVTMTELQLEGVRTSSLRESSLRGRRQLTAIVQQALEESDKPHAERRAQTVVASLEGVIVSALAEPASQRREYVRTTVEMVMNSLAAQDD
ncbi:TetR family transcriptional regulator [Calidifontibacter sp. DB0510]|uniref:TetR family transcriptional regulator n=1 Tax=Metallococcus carri TaxID=1656884 RepID=A0A967EAQ8_9MICO|nr:TetR family transcriptional regulator [Metallococcus carri]NHN56520.1 TetR family transcriptional regulator [Metallococcus carri]NOP38819.1 TetR family transcriptional regulator [Calidifontibacter sp. DB2511S]